VSSLESSLSVVGERSRNCVRKARDFFNAAGYWMAAYYNSL
jgi:hypothetical protein